MSAIGGVYTPGIQTVTLTAATTGPKHIVHLPIGVGAQNSPVCIITADMSGETTGSTLTINRGTWDGATFTSVQRLSFLSVLTGTSQSQTILKVIGKDEALQFVVTGDANTKGHIRIEGNTIAV